MVVKHVKKIHGKIMGMIGMGKKKAAKPKKSKAKSKMQKKAKSKVKKKAKKRR